MSETRHKEVVKMLTKTYKPHGIGVRKQGSPVGSGEYKPAEPMVAGTALSISISPKQDTQQKAFNITQANIQNLANDFSFGQPTSEQLREFVKS